MSKTDMERFATAVRSDKDLQEQIKKAATSNEAIVEFGKSRGYDVTLDEVLAYIDKRKASLSIEDLDKVAGGKSHAQHHTQEIGQAEVAVVAAGFEAEAAVSTTTAMAQAECVIVAT